ncbi:MAG: DUF4271 domain-containing protein [bacterium]|nr:DUF4271 domain-containing protein [bacterium]
MSIVEYQHIFSNHLLKQFHAAPEVKNSHELIWPSVFLIFCLCLLALVKGRALPRLIRIVQSTFSNQILQQLEREELNSLKFYATALNTFFVLNLSFLIYKVNSIYHIVLVDFTSFVQFCFFLFAVVLLLSFKRVVNIVLAAFTDSRRLISDYTTNSTLVNQTFGLFLFPWIILLEFTTFNPLLFISGGVIILSGAVLLKWYRGIIMGLLVERIGILQIFSYFCGLEILPLFVMVKYIIVTF